MVKSQKIANTSADLQKHGKREWKSVTIALDERYKSNYLWSCDLRNVFATIDENIILRMKNRRTSTITQVNMNFDFEKKV